MTKIKRDRERGRPSKLNEEVQEKLIQAIEIGVSYIHACAYAGIHYDTFNRWRNRGEEETKGQYHDFYVAIKEAEGRGVAKSFAKIQTAASEGAWQAAAWILERRYPELYGRKPALGITVDDKSSTNSDTERDGIVADVFFKIRRDRGEQDT